ncbi:MAG: hypothetical protein CL930_09220 [Deltaproteobacteria bacterium]|nr:hypothetical protein [Deltaproteobacteria bacterium]
MESSQSWPVNSEEERTETGRLPWFGVDSQSAPRYSPASVEPNGVELNRLGGYAMVIALMAGCMLLSAWSRIDLRETAVALDKSERAYTTALAESTRLKLELSTLEDPAWLTESATNLSLQATVPVVDLTLPAKQ